jgi:hypothetical protein
METINDQAVVTAPVEVVDPTRESRDANASLRAMTARKPVEVEAIVEAPAAQAPVETPAPAVAAVPDLKEFSYSYQIRDEAGNPVGNMQVQKYRAAQELPIETFESAIKAHTHATLALRDLKRKQTFEVPDPSLTDADRVTDDVVEFKPRELSAGENFALSQDLLDPAKAAQARAKITEAELGAPASAVGTTLNRVQEKNLILMAKLEVSDFIAANPSYYKCQDNFKKLTDYMVVNGLKPTAVNFQRAYDTLLADGFLQTGPTVREVAPVQEVVQEPQATQPAQETPDSGITVEQPAAERAPVRIPTGLTKTTASDTGTKLPTARTYTAAEIDKMSAEDYKKLVVEPEFRARRAAPRNQQ